jgi:hypothetical protein
MMVLLFFTVKEDGWSRGTKAKGGRRGRERKEGRRKEGGRREEVGGGRRKE